MATLSYSVADFTAYTRIRSADVNSKFTSITTWANGNIENDNIKASAAIAYSKLNLTGSIVNADINASAAIATSKLSPPTRSMVRVYGGNGNGGSNPLARRWSTTDANTGSGITYADAAGAGGTFTIVSAGIYAITCTESVNVVNVSTQYVAVTKNRTSGGLPSDATLLTSYQWPSLSQAADSGTDTEADITTNDAWTVTVSWVGVLAANDVIRVITSGVLDNDTARFTITKLNDIP